MGVFNCCRPKYDVQYCPCTNCDSRHPFSRVKRERCQKTQSCTNTLCGPMASMGEQGFTLYYDCLKFCNGDPERYTRSQDYLCGQIGAEVLFTNYGLTPCADFFPETMTQEGRQKAEKDKQEKAAIGQQKSTMIWLFALALVLTGIFAFKK